MCPCIRRGLLTLHRKIGAACRNTTVHYVRQTHREGGGPDCRLSASKPISGRLLAVAEHGWRKKPGGVGAVPFGEGVGVSPDIIDNIAEDGVAQGSVLYDVGDVGAECFAQSGVEGGKLREAEGFITEALHQIGGNILGGEAVFSGNDGRMQFLVSLPRRRAGGKGADMGRCRKERGAEVVARWRVAPFGNGGKLRDKGRNGRVALGAVGGYEPVHAVARCRGEVLIADDSKAVDGLHEVERGYRVGECAVRGDSGERSMERGEGFVGENSVYDGRGAESGEDPLLGGVEPMGDFVKERGFAFDGDNLVRDISAEVGVVIYQFVHGGVLCRWLLF